MKYSVAFSCIWEDSTFSQGNCRLNGQCQLSDIGKQFHHTTDIVNSSRLKNSTINKILLQMSIE